MNYLVVFLQNLTISSSSEFRKYAEFKEALFSKFPIKIFQNLGDVVVISMAIKDYDDKLKGFLDGYNITHSTKDPIHY